jgi:hypothetical protein
MAALRRIRDKALIDAVEALPARVFEGSVWRVVREGRDVLMPSAAGGRWDDATFEVLYTSQTADGATAELYFHLSRGQPVIPSRVTYRLFELQVRVERALHLRDLDALARLGLETARYGALSYADRVQEYPRTQEIAETAHFLGFDGLVVPNARWDCLNVILFTDHIAPDAMEVSKDCGPIDWDAWKKKKEPFGR